MKNVIKIAISVFVLFSVFILLFCTFNTSFIYAADNFKPGDYKPGAGSGDAKLLEVGNRIVGPIQMIGSLISVVAIILIGIRYMVGSVEEKAQYKETMKPYVIGAALVFGITTILGIVNNITVQIFK